MFFRKSKCFIFQRERTVIPCILCEHLRVSPSNIPFRQCRNFFLQKKTEYSANLCAIALKFLNICRGRRPRRPAYPTCEMFLKNCRGDHPVVRKIGGSNPPSYEKTKSTQNIRLTQINYSRAGACLPQNNRL